jgi:hypothetical protein
MTKFEEWQPKPEHVQEFHFANVLAYRDLAHLLVRAVRAAPIAEFSRDEREVLKAFMTEALDERWWATPSRPQNF